MFIALFILIQLISYNSILFCQIENTDNNIIELKEYIDLRFKELEKRINIQFEQITKSTALSLVQLNDRFANTNEWRNALNDIIVGSAKAKDVESNIKLIRDEFVSITSVIRDDVQGLQLSRATLEGKASQSSVVIGYVISTLGIMIGIVNVLLFILLKKHVKQ